MGSRLTWYSVGVAAHGRVECRNTQRPVEQLAVGVGEPREVFVVRSLALGLRRVQHLEQLRQPQAESGPVFAGPRLEEIEEDAARFEDAGMVREQAEHDPHQEPLQVVTPVVRFVKRVMQPPDQFGGLGVGWVLVGERPALQPEDEAERLDMARQFRKRERDGLPVVKIVQLEVLEVAYQNM